MFLIKKAPTKKRKHKKINKLFDAQFFAGIVGHSAAMIADAGHSLSDLMSDGVTLWAVRLSRLPPDDDHPYGHGR